MPVVALAGEHVSRTQLFPAALIVLDLGAAALYAADGGLAPGHRC